MEICKNCPAGCCRHYGISLTGHDVFRIAKSTNMEIKKFCELIPLRDAEPSEKDYALKFSDLDQDKMYVLKLKKIESENYPRTNKCIFLDETVIEKGKKGEKRVKGICSIYLDRPASCRTYPAVLRENNAISIRNVLEEEKGKITHVAYNLCPRPFVKKDFEPELYSFRQDLIIAKLERNLYFDIVSNWNVHPGKSTAYIVFLMDIYSRLGFSVW